MLTFPNIDPIAFKLGPISIYWYGVCYLLGFISGYFLGVWQLKKYNITFLDSEKLADLLFYIALGVILGGRIGYQLFYYPNSLIDAPWSLLQFWERGRSFHGGLIGVIISIIWFSYKKNIKLLQLADFIAPLVPLAIFFGRIGNFINGELWGRITTKSWGVIFPHVDNFPRHPSQLYEAALEGLLLFIIVTISFNKLQKRPGTTVGIFLIGYAVLRIIVEFWREPDLEQGFVVFNCLTMGQILSLPMLFLGIFFVMLNLKKFNR